MLIFPWFRSLPAKIITAISSAGVILGIVAFFLDHPGAWGTLVSSASSPVPLWASVVAFVLGVVAAFLFGLGIGRSSSSRKWEADEAEDVGTDPDEMEGGGADMLLKAIKVVTSEAHDRIANDHRAWANKVAELERLKHESEERLGTALTRASIDQANLEQARAEARLRAEQFALAVGAFRKSADDAMEVARTSVEARLDRVIGHLFRAANEATKPKGIEGSKWEIMKGRWMVDGLMTYTVPKGPKVRRQ